MTLVEMISKRVDDAMASMAELLAAQVFGGSEEWVAERAEWRRMHPRAGLRLPKSALPKAEKRRLMGRGLQ